MPRGWFPQGLPAAARGRRRLIGMATHPESMASRSVDSSRQHVNCKRVPEAGLLAEANPGPFRCRAI